MPGGRPPKPLKEQMRKGNPGKKKLPAEKTIKKAARASGLSARSPAWLQLSQDAQKIWAQIVPELKKEHFLGVNKLDQPLLARYCSFFAHWQAADKQLAGLTSLTVETKSSFVEMERKHPLVALSLQLHIELKKIETEFLMNPSVRLAKKLRGLNSGADEGTLFAKTEPDQRPASSPIGRLSPHKAKQEESGPTINKKLN